MRIAGQTLRSRAHHCTPMTQQPTARECNGKPKRLAAQFPRRAARQRGLFLSLPAAYPDLFAARSQRSPMIKTNDAYQARQQYVSYMLYLCSVQAVLKSSPRASPTPLSGAKTRETRSKLRMVLLRRESARSAYNETGRDALFRKRCRDFKAQSDARDCTVRPMHAKSGCEMIPPAHFCGSLRRRQACCKHLSQTPNGPSASALTPGCAEPRRRGGPPTRPSPARAGRDSRQTSSSTRHRRNLRRKTGQEWHSTCHARPSSRIPAT